MFNKLNTYIVSQLVFTSQKFLMTWTQHLAFRKYVLSNHLSLWVVMDCPAVFQCRSFLRARWSVFSLEFTFTCKQILFFLFYCWGMNCHLELLNVISPLDKWVTHSSTVCPRCHCTFLFYSSLSPLLCYSSLYPSGGCVSYFCLIYCH